MNLSKIKQVVKEHYEIDNTDRWIEDTYEFMLPNYHTNLPSDYKHNVDKVSLYNTDMILNEHWFRSDTFDTNDDGILFLGCSLTLGVGIDDEQLVWPWIVGKHFNKKVWNLGIGAQGEDMCFKLAQKWIPKLKPSAVCMLIPPRGRYHFSRPEEIDYVEWKKEPYWFRNKEKCFTHRNKEMALTLYEKENLYFNCLSDIYSIQSLCKNIPFVVESYERFINYKKHGTAKDNHPGPLYHEWVSEFFIENLK